MRIPGTNIVIGRNLEKRGTSSSDFLTGFTSLSSRTLSGVKITKRNAMEIAAFYSGVRIITDAISSLPNQVIRVEGSSRTRDKEHQVYSLLAQKPNDLMTPYVFDQLMIPPLLIWGNAYAIIEFDPRTIRPIALLPVHPSRVKVEMIEGILWYTFRMDKGADIVLDQSNVIHYRGLGDIAQGKSVIDYASNNLGLGRAAEDFGATFFGNGANMHGVLESDKELSPKAIANLRESIDTIHGGISRSNKMLILEEGLTFNTTSIPPDKAQFLETRKFSVTDVARWLKLPPHLLADLEKATFTNIEQQDLNFVKLSILPWLINIEQENNRKLLREDEKGTIFTKKNLDGLLRGDIKSRTNAYKLMIQNGIMFPNEARAMEEMNPYEGGDSAWMPINIGPINEEGTNQTGINENSSKVPNTPEPDEDDEDE